MAKIKKIDLRIRRTGGGLFHDSRADVRVLTELIETCIEKINELVIANNELQDHLARTTTEIELPEPIEFDDGHDEPSRHYWPIQIKNAIKSQGYQVRVKGE